LISLNGTCSFFSHPFANQIPGWHKSFIIHLNHFYILLNIEYLKIYCLQKENQSFSFLIGPHNEIDGRRPKEQQKFAQLLNRHRTGHILQEHAEPTTSLADQTHFLHQLIKNFRPTTQNGAVGRSQVGDAANK
jgi:hypothetical protein